MQDELSYRLEPTGDVKRDRALATQVFSAGGLISSVRPLATVLLPFQKGRWCDYCLRRLTSTLRCSACKEYWYCDRRCQTNDWQERHKRTCSIIKTSQWQSFVQSLSVLDLLDVLLLTHLFTAHYQELFARFETGEDLLSEHSLFLHLLPAVQGQCLEIPTLQKLLHAVSWELRLIKHACARFRNNNFEIACGLDDGLAHGIFPLTSRSFNHSCAPNAIAVYSFDANGVCQNVIALRDIPFGEEITLAYLDPAMSLDKRQEKLRAVYGFECRCSLCQFQGQVVIPSVPTSGPLREALAAELRTFGDREGTNFASDCSKLPPSLLGVFDEPFLSSIAEPFARLSHEGPFVDAIYFGEVLRGLYKVIYPPLHPLIGYHDLELGKTVWNAIARNEIRPKEEVRFRSKALGCLQSAGTVLEAVGQADKDTGWGLEVNQLRAVLAETHGT